MQWGRRPAVLPLLVGLAVSVIAAPVLFATHHDQRPLLSKRRAVQLTLSAPPVRTALGNERGVTERVESFDGQLTRVDLFRRDQVVAAVGVTRSGQVQQFQDYARQRVPYGNWIAYQPGMIAVLSLLFVLMTAVWPLRRLRNLDVLAALTITGSVVLFADRYLQLSLLVAAVPLAYLLGRCAAVGFGVARLSSAEQPMFDLAAGRLPPDSRRRILRLTLVAVAVAYVMIGVSSPQPVDVIYAVMEGATRLLHGMLPYGHLPGDVVHGDTYPLFSYLSYVPLAAVAPVKSVWDSVDVALGATVLAALASAAMLWRGTPARNAVPEEDRLRMALSWLCFPPILIATSSGTTDLPLAAMLLGAVLLWRRPGAAGALLTAAGWFKLAPFALLLVCLAARRGRALIRCALAAVLVSIPMVTVLIVLGGVNGVSQMIHGIAFQFDRGSPQSVWATLGLAAWQPVAEALCLGLLAAAAVRAHQGPELEQSELAALFAAILIGLQLAANYWSFLYVVWIIPLLAVSLFAAAPARQAVAVRWRGNVSGARIPVAAT